MKTWTTIDKSEWGDGAWQDEPDKIQWIDEATDLDCLIVRGNADIGSLCGYVGVPPGHPWHGKGYHDVEPEPRVHGGLTFADSCMEDMPEGTGVCHIPEPGRPADVWWLGFDCGHAMDLSPAIEAIGRRMGYAPDRFGAARSYKPVAYVRAEVRDLAKQVASAQ
jgi:hypothetical protein